MHTYTHSVSVALTISTASPPQPLRQVTDKVKEEVALRDTDDLITDHNEQGEPLGAEETQTLGYCTAEVSGPSA